MKPTYWLTRDADPETGAPSAHVDVWLSRPNRYAVGDHGCFWLDRHDTLERHHGSWSLGFARTIGPVPDDSRQCLRVGIDTSDN